MPQIITFYSFKGGVGRTVAVANVACLMAAKGRKVLVVDWDLEAPGLHRYFTSCAVEEPQSSSGTVGLLEAMADNQPSDSAPFESLINIPQHEFFPGCKLSLLQAGMWGHDYQRRVLDFDLAAFYRKRKGAFKLEALRQTWRDRFDFVLIDSRTGITDTGGVCTIFLPDVLALVFSANEQSLAGAIDVAHRAQKGRQALSFDRRGLTLLPIPSRIDRTEQEESDLWMKRFTDEVSPLLAAWCPREVAPRLLLERIRVPYAPYFSFGEKLPVITHSLTDLDLPGLRYQNIASILEANFEDEVIMSVCGVAKEEKWDLPRACDISRIVKYAPAELIGRESETALLNNAWARVQNGEPQRPHILTFVGLGGEGKTSLVAKWAADLAFQDWPGCDAVFAWSFYSQGTREQVAASSDLFLKEALTFFGDDADKEFAASPAGAFEKGQRLARIVASRRSLLILDGLEPLQYAPTSPTPGELKDQGIGALLKGLAATSHGLCVVTTRYSIPDLRAFWHTTAPEVPLLRLSRESGVHLLKSMGVRGSELRNLEYGPNKEKVNEFEKLVEDVKGHALTLTLLGGFLKRAFRGDIRKRDLVKLERADEMMDGGHAFRTMAAHEQWLLRDGGDEGRHEVAVLRLMGLFDRPADAGCLAALRSETIPGLTEPLTGLADDDWEYCLNGLEAAKLLTVNRDASGALVSLDAHPHLREYFARQLRAQQPDAWRAAHRRLYEYLCETTPDKPQPTLEDLQPLYQAVAHGCQAGLHEEVAVEVYGRRILRGNENYATAKLGAFGTDLKGVACFFDEPWKRVSLNLTKAHAGWLLNEAAFGLRALGRLTEAIEPVRAALSIRVAQENWNTAAISASNLSELELTLGEVVVAVEDAEQSVICADRSSDASRRMVNRTTHAYALHQAGRQAEAETRFREAEQMQTEQQPDYPLLYSLGGFRYCDLLLAAPERAAWQIMQRSEFRDQKSELSAECRAIANRAGQTLNWVTGKLGLLDEALDHLTLGRAALYEVVLAMGGSPLKTQNSELKGSIGAAVDGLRRAGMQDMLPRGLLSRAWLRFLTGTRTGPESAQEDLDEAWEIAERGPMRLFMADIHLYRARLFGGMKDDGGGMRYPWDKNPDGTPRGPKDDLDAAEKLINDCGYHRRDEELADAREAAKNW